MVGGEENKQRLAAILAADAAGYSRLMAVDDQATVATLDAARAVFRSHIESNQGRVIDMAGDSVLAVFETAAGAVTAALGIQQALQVSTNAVPENSRMPFRIGVHLGDVIEKTDGTVYGDGVNIAARQAEMVLKLNPDFNLSGGAGSVPTSQRRIASISTTPQSGQAYQSTREPENQRLFSYPNPFSRNISSSPGQVVIKALTCLLDTDNAFPSFDGNIRLNIFDGPYDFSGQSSSLPINNVASKR